MNAFWRILFLLSSIALLILQKAWIGPILWNQGSSAAFSLWLFLWIFELLFFFANTVLMMIYIREAWVTYDDA